MKTLLLCFGIWVALHLLAEYQVHHEPLSLALLGLLFFGAYKLVEKEKWVQ